MRWRTLWKAQHAAGVFDEGTSSYVVFVNPFVYHKLQVRRYLAEGGVTVFLCSSQTFNCD